MNKKYGAYTKLHNFSRPIKYRFFTIINKYLFKIDWTTKKAIMYHLGHARNYKAAFKKKPKHTLTKYEAI